MFHDAHFFPFFYSFSQVQVWTTTGLTYTNQKNYKFNLFIGEFNEICKNWPVFSPDPLCEHYSIIEEIMYTLCGFRNFGYDFWGVEGDFANMFVNKFPLVLLGSRVEGLACTDPGAKTPNGASGIYSTSHFVTIHINYGPFSSSFKG